MRRTLLRVQLVLAALVVLGVWVQVYLIAAYIFGADALDAHRAVGYATFALELLVFLAALGAWWRTWGRVGHAFSLALVGAVQISLSGADDWVGGVHGLLALVILIIAVFVVKDDAEELKRERDAGADAGMPLPRP